MVNQKTKSKKTKNNTGKRATKLKSDSRAKRATEGSEKSAPYRRVKLIPPPTPERSPSITPPPELSQKALDAAVQGLIGLAASRGQQLPDVMDNTEVTFYPGSENEDGAIYSDEEHAAGQKRSLFAAGIEEDDNDESDEYPEQVTAMRDEGSNTDEVTDDADEDEDEDKDEESGDDDENVPQKAPTKGTNQRKVAKARTTRASAIQSLTFSVPHDGACEEVEISASTSWKDFIDIMANTIGVAPKNVELAYRFSIATSTTSYQHLKDEKNLRQLFQKACLAKESTKSKKPFYVDLKDLNPPTTKDKTSRHLKKKARRSKVSDSEDGDGEEIDSTNIRKRKTACQWVAELEQANRCEEHQRACLKTPQGCIPLTKNDLGGWGLFLECGYQSLTEPPPKLTLDSDAATLKKKKAASAPGPVNIASSTQPVSGPPLMAPVYYPPPYGYPSYPPPPPQWYGQFSSPHRYSSKYNDTPSSDPAEEPENLDMFMRIEDFLRALDEGPLGQDGHNFASYSSDFLAEKYFRISDLEGMKPSDLKEVCVTIPLGTAKAILDNCQKEVHRVRKSLQRQQRTHHH